MHRGRAARLLDVDEDLGALIDPDRREEARQAIALAMFDLDPGACDLGALSDAPEVRGDLLGLLVVDGMLTRDAALDARVCSRLLTTGAIVWFDGATTDSLSTNTSWTVHEPTRVIGFDDRFLYACARWPRLLAAVCARLAVQDERALRAQATSQLPRVADRLLGVFWELADQRGRMTSAGVQVDVPFTHETLGQMIGARRPTVSLGLQALQAAGDLSRAGSGWVLAIDSADRLRHGQAAGVEPLAHDLQAARIRILVLANAPVLQRRATGPLVVEVEDEASAISAMVAAPPDVVVVALQRSGGDAVLSHTRRELPGVPLLLVAPGTGTASRLLLEGANAVIEADASELEILARVQQLASSGPAPEGRRREVNG